MSAACAAPNRSAGSFPGGFRTPAPVHVVASATGRHPKPLYGAMLVKPPCLTKLATISSFAAATLFGRPWAHRQALLVVELSCPGRSRRQVRGELAIGRGASRHDLVFGRSAGIRTMMQSCASAAKLRGGGPILHSGLEAMGYHRVTATSDRHRQPLRMGRQGGYPCLSSCSLMPPGARRRPAAPRRSQQDATRR